MHPRPLRFLLTSALLSLLAALSAGCATRNIPNTDVEDTSDNREAVGVVERYRNALEERNVARVLALVSNRYFDDNGTPDGADDLDFGQLRTRFATIAERISAVRYEIRYRRVTFRDDRVLVDFTYSGNFRLTTPEGERWSRRLADNRIVLQREQGELKIVSGL